MSSRGSLALAVTGCLFLHPGAAVLADAFDCSGIPTSDGTTVRAKLVSSSLSSPVDVQAPPGDTRRIFVVEQPGYIRIVDITTDTLLSPAFLDIHTKVQFGGEMGLLGLAFHPNYSENGRFFVNYTRPGGTTGLETVIVRHFVMASDPSRADPDGDVLLTFAQPFQNHNGGQVRFGPMDGYLYISTGDGGDGGDPRNNGQSPTTFLGKILRIDVDGGDPYGIPSTNPFAGSPDMKNEIWDLGTRNPWRFSFDPETGEMYIGDVGQGEWEEVDHEPAGSAGGFNYEWRVREGDHTFSGSTSYGPGTRRDPIIEYPHTDPSSSFKGCAVIGGVVYRGCAMPDLHGTYFFADNCANWVRSFRYTGGQVTDLTDRTAELNAGISPDVLDEISAFGYDGLGEVYICDLTTKLFRIVPANPGATPKTFVRGNSNGDATFDISDAVFTLGRLFLGTPATVDCEDALDTNDDGEVDISDPVYGLLHLFGGGPPPPDPGSDCGRDPTADSLSCARSTCG